MSVNVVVLGAGPAGLAVAAKLGRRPGLAVSLIERGAAAGGNAGSFEIDGVRVDYGSHRLHPTCPPEILADIRQVLGADLLDRPRHGRIRLRGRWVHFPLQPVDLVRNLPIGFAVGSLRDALFKGRTRGGDQTFAGVLERGLGPTICRDFYFPYAEKIWGLSPTELDGEQARRRVSASSPGKLLKKIFGAAPGLAKPGRGRFFYPRRGFGQISDGYLTLAREAKVDVRFRTAVAAVQVCNGRATAVRVDGPAGSERLNAQAVLSTIPLPLLVKTIDPGAPAEVLASCDALRYRAMVLVYLVLETDRFSEFDAHYFPGRDIPVTRISEPKNYSQNGAPGVTVLCAEIPCTPDDTIWSASDDRLGAIVQEALATADLPVTCRVRGVVTKRLRQACPIYTIGYRDHFERLDRWADGIEGLVSLGRQGLFAHDNTHHTLAMAYAACACLDDGGGFDRAAWHAHRKAFESHVVED
jgi:protoporphyrinogen oxidase